MKFLDKVGLIVFANLVLIVSVIICVIIFGWLDLGTVNYVLGVAFTDATSSNIILGVCALF